MLRNKSDLREMNEYRNVFLEQDVSREEREKRRVMIQERKAEWERRGKTDQRRKKCRKEKSTVKLVWKNVRKIRTREK